MKKIPQGDLLRQYLLKSSISTILLSEGLKSKGVLVKSRNKKSTLPFYLKTIMDAKLFSLIENNEVKREKQPKFTNSSIKVKKDFKLDKLCDLKLNLQNDLIDKSEFKLSYALKNVPEFYIDNDSSSTENQIKIGLDIEVEIEDQLENYKSTTIERNARVDVILENNVLIINKNYTSPETKEIIDFVVDKVRRYLREEQYINKNDDFVTIRFNDFDDDKRVEFFKSFKNISDEKIKYKSIIDLDIEYQDNHKGFDKLLDSITNMKVKGDNLENHPFVDDINYYSKILISGIKIKYDFDIGLERGEFVLNLEFPEFKSDSIDENISNPNFVFSINVINCLDKQNVYKIINEVAVIIERYKNEVYSHYKS